MKNKMTVPGPGDYSVVGNKDGPHFSFRPKTSALRTDSVPGPGNYEPRSFVGKEKAPSWIVGKTERSSSAKVTSVPGPGAYSNNSMLGGPKWGFGSEARSKKKRSHVPGPGSYEIKSTMGSAPSYVQVKSSV